MAINPGGKYERIDIFTTAFMGWGAPPTKDAEIAQLKQQLQLVKEAVDKFQSEPKRIAVILNVFNDHVVIRTDGGIMDVAKPPGLVGLRPSDTVRIHPNTMQIYDVIPPYMVSGEVSEVLDVIDDEACETLIKGIERRLVLTGGKKVAKGDRLVLDHAGMSVLRVIPAAKPIKPADDTPVTWDDVGGCEQAKRELIDALETPYKKRDIYARFGQKPIKGILLYGPPGCISGDTEIQYEIQTRSGRRQNHKGGTLERLFRRFHGLPIPGKGSYQRQQTVDSVFMVQSVNDDGQVFMNRIEDVVDSGEKECFRVTTESGRSAEMTIDHEVWMGDRYVELGKLRVGARVAVNQRKPVSRGGKQKAPYRKEVFVKRHRSAPTKVVNGCKYHRLKIYQAVIEADENGMSYDEYISTLNNAPRSVIDRLWSIPEGHEVHHRDENCTNDALDNLELVSKADHLERHREAIRRNIAIYVELEAIVSIEPIGVKHVYDIRCADPYRNFVAGGIVVHNCGKTLLGKAAATSIAKTHGVESSSGFIYVKGPELLNKFLGASEDNVRQLFRRARAHKQTHGFPALVFIDEADAILGNRSNDPWNNSARATVVPQFLSEMDGMEDSGAFILLATNRPDTLDPAVVRDGRIDRRIKITRPDKPTVRDIAAIHLKGKPGVTTKSADELTDQITDERWKLYEVDKKSGETIRVTLANTLNGAMIAGVVARAVQSAIRREIESGEESVITSGDIREAVRDAYLEASSVDHTEVVLDLVDRDQIKAVRNVAPKD